MPKMTQRQLEIAGLKKVPGKGPGLTYQELEIVFYNRKIRSLHNRTYNLRSSDENVRVFFKALDYLVHAALTYVVCFFSILGISTRTLVFLLLLLVLSLFWHIFRCLWDVHWNVDGNKQDEGC
jgi:hypothetical protein